MGRFTFNRVHHQQQHCMTSLNIHWNEVLFNFCLVYMHLVVATRLAVLKENSFEAVLRPDTSCSQEERNHHHLSLYHQQKMLPTCTFNVLTTYSSHSKKLQTAIPTFPDPLDIDGQILMDLWLFSGILIPYSIFEFVFCNCKNIECLSDHHVLTAVNLLCTDLFVCINCKYNDSQERVDVNETFDDVDNFGEYHDEDTSGGADESSSNDKDKLFDDDEIEND